MMEVFAIFLFVYIVIIVACMGLGIVQYVFTGIGLQTIAKRRGIRDPWLAWVPVGNVWVLGCISDQYQYLTKGVQRSKRKFLMGLTVATVVVSVVCFVTFYFCVAEAMSDEETTAGILLMMGQALLMGGLGVWNAVLVYMATYDLFVSADPKNAVLFLVLSIFLGGVVNAVLLFLCRNKDQGMPVRPPTTLPEDRWHNDM